MLLLIIILILKISNMRMCHFNPEYNRILAECYMNDSEFRNKLDELGFDKDALITNLIKYL